MIIVNAGYSAAFLTLATVAVAGFVLFLLAMPETAAGAQGAPSAVPA